MIGKTKLSTKEIEVLRALCLYVCQHCKLNEYSVGKLTPHRLTRQNAGGKYCPNNLLLVCNSCHGKLHAGERMGRK